MKRLLVTSLWSVTFLHSVLEKLPLVVFRTLRLEMLLVIELPPEIERSPRQPTLTAKRYPPHRHPPPLTSPTKDRGKRLKQKHMAILTGINTRLRGSAGDWTFSRLGGQTVAKQKVEAKATPKRTFAQMVRRVQWANIVNLYRCFEGNLHPSFENRDARVSDYNEFVSANICAVPIYLTKDEARQGGCVVGAYQVTRGSLPSISIVSDGAEAPKTDIALGSLTIGANTTLKDFSDAVIANNDNFEHGDQISCFIARQTTDANTNVPYVKIDALEITLDQTDNVTKLWDVADASGFSNVGTFLGASSTINGAITWVHSRKSQSGTRVSTQRFVVTNSVLSSFNTNAKRTEAILSYGGLLSDEFLTPNDTTTADIDSGGTSDVDDNP